MSDAVTAGQEWECDIEPWECDIEPWEWDVEPWPGHVDGGGDDDHG